MTRGDPVLTFVRETIGLLAAVEVVFHADDVVFAGVLAHLHFHDDERELALVLEAVNFAHRDVGGLVRTHVEDLVADGDRRGTAHDHPVFGTVQVLLKAEALARLHHDALHLVAFGGFEHGVRAPRAAHGLRHVDEVGTAGLEFFHNLLHLLAAAERGHQEGIRRVDDEHLVEVDGRDGALGSHHEGILGTDGDVARVHVVAVFVVRIFPVQAIKTAEVAPADIARHDLHLVRLFHDGVVDGIARDGEHVVAVDADRFAIFDRGLLEGGLRRGEDIRRMFLQFVEECLRLEAEDAAVPVEVARNEVLLGSCQIGLLDKAFHVLAVGLDVAVTGLGASRRDAEGHQVAGFGEFLRTEQNLPVLVLLADHVVRRGNEHDGVGLQGKAGERNRGSGVAAHGFQQELAAGMPFGFELVLREEELVGVRDNELRLANGGVGDHRLAEEGLPVEKRGELLGHERAAHGPKARSGATAENQVNHDITFTKRSAYFQPSLLSS